MRITLLQKRGSLPAADFGRALYQRISSLTADLSASLRLRGFTKGGWAELEIDGPDEEIVSELLTREFNVAPVELSKVSVGDSIDGVVERVSKESVTVDVGIERPAICKVSIPLNELQAQLADGQPFTLPEIAEAYCIHPGAKLGIRVTRMEPEKQRIAGCLSDSQIEALAEWTRLGLDRIVALSCAREQAQSAVGKLRLERDVIEVESVLLVEQSFLCKLGTDAVGLIPRLGRALPSTELISFIPKRIIRRFRQWL